jgi:hypothetical protein
MRLRKHRRVKLRFLPTPAAVGSRAIKDRFCCARAFGELPAVIVEPLATIV